MSGAPLVAGMLVVTATLAVAIAASGAASARAVQLAGVADAAALAAADASTGLAAGVPCERAADLASRGQARLEACAVDGAVVTVTVSAVVGPFDARARARAGPAP